MFTASFTMICLLEAVNNVSFIQLANRLYECVAADDQQLVFSSVIIVCKPAFCVALAAAAEDSLLVRKLQ